jgi:hypothetical protein
MPVGIRPEDLIKNPAQRHRHLKSHQRPGDELWLSATFRRPRLRGSRHRSPACPSPSNPAPRHCPRRSQRGCFLSTFGHFRSGRRSPRPRRDTVPESSSGNGLVPPLKRRSCHGCSDSRYSGHDRCQADPPRPDRAAGPGRPDTTASPDRT